MPASPTSASTDRSMSEQKVTTSRVLHRQPLLREPIDVHPCYKIVMNSSPKWNQELFSTSRSGRSSPYREDPTVCEACCPLHERVLITEMRQRYKPTGTSSGRRGTGEGRQGTKGSTTDLSFFARVTGVSLHQVRNLSMPSLSRTKKNVGPGVFHITPSLSLVSSPV